MRVHMHTHAQDNTYSATDPELEACIANGTFDDFVDATLKCTELLHDTDSDMQECNSEPESSTAHDPGDGAKDNILADSL